MGQHPQATGRFSRAGGAEDGGPLIATSEAEGPGHLDLKSLAVFGGQAEPLGALREGRRGRLGGLRRGRAVCGARAARRGSWGLGGASGELEYFRRASGRWALSLLLGGQLGGHDNARRLNRERDHSKGGIVHRLLSRLDGQMAKRVGHRGRVPGRVGIGQHPVGLRSLESDDRVEALQHAGQATQIQRCALLRGSSLSAGSGSGGAWWGGSGSAWALGAAGSGSGLGGVSGVSGSLIRIDESWSRTWASWPAVSSVAWEKLASRASRRDVDVWRHSSSS